MICRMSPEQDILIKQKIGLIKEIQSFEIEGHIFEGNGNHAAVEFAYNNPNGGGLCHLAR